MEKSYLFTAKLLLGPRFIVLAMCSLYKNRVAIVLKRSVATWGKPDRTAHLFLNPDMTGKETVNGKNIRRDPRVMLCIDDERPPFAFVLIEGTAVAADLSPAKRPSFLFADHPSQHRGCGKSRCQQNLPLTSSAQEPTVGPHTRP